MIFSGHTNARQGDGAKGRFPQYVLGLTVAGTSRHNLDADPIELRRGDIQLIRPNTPQRWESGQRWESWHCVFDPRPHWRAWLNYPWRHGYHVMHLGDSPRWSRMVTRLRDAVAWNTSAYSHRDELQLNALEEVLLWCHEHHRSAVGEQDERVADALQHIARHLAEPLDLVSIAEAVGVSRSRLAELFGRQIGLGVMQYVEQQRMERARQLLRYTSDTVAGVAEQVGYPDAKYFSKRFHAAVGSPPRTWRNHARRGE